MRAVEDKAPIEFLVRSRVLLRSGAAHRAVKALSVPIVDVSPEAFRTLQIAPRASGVGVVCRQVLGQPGSGLWLAARSIRNPGNLGTLLRTAEAVGAEGLICVGGRLDPYDPKVVRATMGGHFGLKFARMGAGQLRSWARDRGAQIVGTAADAPARWDQHRFARTTVVVVGDEGEGMVSWVRSLCTHTVSLPMRGGADSLNVAVAGSVVLYEVLRQQA